MEKNMENKMEISSPNNKHESANKPYNNDCPFQRGLSGPELWVYGSGLLGAG